MYFPVVKLIMVDVNNTFSGQYLTAVLDHYSGSHSVSEPGLIQLAANSEPEKYSGGGGGGGCGDGIWARRTKAYRNCLYSHARRQIEC